MITFCIVCVSLVSSPDAKPSLQEDEFRKVEVIAPAISCYSRFKESLEKKVRDRNNWIRSVSIKALNKKVVKDRPVFDFGNDVLLTFEIENKSTARELATLIHQSRYYMGTEFWVLKSGHKMKDIKDIRFSKLITTN